MVNKKEQVISVSSGFDGNPSDLEGTALVQADSGAASVPASPILWLRSEVDADGCFFLQHKTSGKLFTLEPFVTERLIEIDQAGDFGGGILRINKQSNVIKLDPTQFKNQPDQPSTTSSRSQRFAGVTPK